MVPFFYKRNKTPTFAALVLKDLTNLLPKNFNTFCPLFLSASWVFEISREFSRTKSNAFFVSVLILCFFFQEISSVYRKCTVFQVLFKTNSYFCWLCFLHLVWVRKLKKWQQPVPDHFDDSEDFFSELFLWITVWRASKQQSNCFGTKSNWRGSPLTSKATNGSFDRGVWNWIKGNIPRFEKSARTRLIETSCELPAGAGKFPPVRRGNRR